MAPIRFAGGELQPQERRLLVDGEPVRLGARAFDVLIALAERAGELVTKNQLLDLVWPDVVVAENNLTVQISSLRKALGSQVIATIPGRGYRFTATLEPVASHQAPGAAAPAGDRSGTQTATSLLPLIGREDELVTLRALTREYPVVSVVGAGGIGKTHLARHLLHLQATEAGADGQFVDLSGLRPGDEDQLPRTVAYALGIQLGPGDPARGLADALAERKTLLVLDNAEHLVSGVARLAQALIETAPGLHLVVTSQVPLGISSERVFRLDGLALPDGRVGAAQALTYSAIAFFSDRAQAADRRFALTDDNADLIAEICRQLDGLALAIELAASRVPTLGLRGIAAALEQRFRLLTGGRRLAPARQQTLHAALDWSHGLLEPSEQTVFRRLGVFIGSFALETAQRVAADEALDEWAVLDALSSLVDRSLLVPTDDDPPRYRLLDTPRAYAREQLAAADEVHIIASRHARALRDRFCRADEDWLSGRSSVDSFRDDSERDLADGKAALAWAAQHDPEAAVAMAPCLDWAMVNEPASARHALWDLTTPLLDESVVPAARLSRWWAGWYQFSILFDGSRHVKDVERAIDQVRRLGEWRAVYWMLRCRIWALAIAALGDRSAVEISERCIREMRELEDPSWPAALRILRMRAESENCSTVGDLPGAIRWLRRAVALSAEAGDSRARYSAMVALVDAELSLRRYDDAVQHSVILVDALRSSRLENTLTHARLNLVLAHVWRHDFAAARTVAAEAWPLLVRFDLTGLLSNNLALLAALEGRPADAAHLAGYADYRNELHGRDRQSNEENAVREAERIASDALGAEEVARLKGEGAGLTQAGVRRLVLDDFVTCPAA